jgi:hypothetical protein
MIRVPKSVASFGAVALVADPALTQNVPSQAARLVLFNTAT